MKAAVDMLDGCYKLENMKVQATACKANIPSNISFRGFGVPQVLLILENILFHVACELNISQEQVYF